MIDRNSNRADTFLMLISEFSDWVGDALWAFYRGDEIPSLDDVKARIEQFESAE